jgi:CHAT domain-containing protein
LTQQSASKSAAAPGIDLANAYFGPLPGTAGEARALQTLLRGASALTGARATETALKQLHGPKLLHIATHGFFFEDAKPQPADGRGWRAGASGEPAAGGRLENPLLRSGLALAGANGWRGGQANQTDDGILTALEVAGLDLWGTRMVVLSACDTGVGEVRSGEGVYGLRRALVLSGAETQVISLWPVSDNATRDLMIEYYRRLQRNEGRSEALRRVQLKMLKSGAGETGQSNRLLTQQDQPAVEARKSTRKKDRSHPYYWASFIQSGGWANLEAKR